MGFPIFVELLSLGMSRVTERIGSHKEAWGESGHQGPIGVSVRVPLYVSETKDRLLSEPRDNFMLQFMRLDSQLTRSTAGPDAESRVDRVGRASPRPCIFSVRR